MTVFNHYARYYDLLYRDKDYFAEADYLHGLIQTNAPDAKTVLNLGCGSGRHDQELAKFGYSITGVDLSQEMLNMARRAGEGNAALQYHQGDIRSIRLKQQFDVVLALFHVISYQTSNQDLLAAFETARCHLRPGGIFVFDCWYGPGVLADPPAVRVKELEDAKIKITRIAQPVMQPNKNLVDVNYLLFIRDKQSNTVDEIRETHSMRYLFVPEIEMMLNATDLKVDSVFEWMNETAPTFESWNAVLVCG